MRHPLVTTAVALVLIAPAPAWAQDSATPSPTPSSCATSGRMAVSLAPTRVTAGEAVTLTATYTGALTEGHVTIADDLTRNYRWADPTRKAAPEWAPGHAARRQVLDVPEGEVVVHTWTLRPATNTRLAGVAFGYQAGCFYADGFLYPPAPTVIDVAPRLTLDAVRHGPRDYTFSGTATRPGQVLSLYRVNADGSEVLTTQTRATAAQTWSKRRVFLGSGRFGFVVRTGRDMANAPGASGTRPTVIH